MDDKLDSLRGLQLPAKHPLHLNFDPLDNGNREENTSALNFHLIVFQEAIERSIEDSCVRIVLFLELVAPDLFL